MKSQNLHILIKSKDRLKTVLKVKELSNSDILYNFMPLDGKEMSTLVGEELKVVSNPGDVKFKYADYNKIDKPVDHFSIHKSGYNVISGKEKELFEKNHHGILMQPKLDQPFEFRPFGIIAIAALDRFPDYQKVFDPQKDTIIPTAANIDSLAFEVDIIGKKLERDKPIFLGISAHRINPHATDIKNLFKNSINWFFLPLTTYTLLFVIKEKPASAPSPPHTVFIRYEYSKSICKTHIAYLE